MKRAVYKAITAWILTGTIFLTTGSYEALAAQDSPDTDTESSNGTGNPVSLEMNSVDSAASDVSYTTSLKAAGKTLREGLKDRQTSITVGYISQSSGEEQISEDTKSIFEIATDHTKDPEEGDYLKFQCGGYETSVDVTKQDEDEGYYLALTYTVSYYSTAEQEKEVGERITALNSELGLNGENLSDYGKVGTIYDYICKKVAYDDGQADSEQDTLKYTAYAALINGKAVCQGYTALFYRWALECGLDVRIISGTADGEPHAWNIVCLNNYYYNVDATWDADTVTHDTYFLKGSSVFEEHHNQDLEYLSSVFINLYPVNENDYNKDNPEEGPVQTGNYSGNCGENLSYEFDSDTNCLTITGNGSMTDYNQQDHAPWYSLRADIETVSVAEGVTSLGNEAFDFCINLSSVSLPESLTGIGDHAFRSCRFLQKLTLPDGLLTIGEGAFSLCAKLRLTSGTFPSHLTSISADAFANCNLNEALELPSSITSVGESAFYKTAITQISIDGKDVFIGDSAFQDCQNLTTVTVNGSLSAIGSYAFSGCGIAEINLPEGLISIGDYAFHFCQNLKELSLPASVRSIGSRVFALTEIPALMIDEDNPSYCTQDGILYNHDKTELVFCYYYATGETLEIIDGVEKIAAYAFCDGCISAPDTLTTSLSMPDSVVEIGESAFYGMNDLQSISFGTNLATIGSAAFSDIRSLETINFKGSLPKIADDAFADVIAVCYYPDGWGSIPSSESYGGYLYWLKYGEPLLPRSGTCGDSVTWTLDEDGIMSISGTGDMTDYSVDFQQYSPWYAFRNRIKTVNVEDGITSVGAYAFADSSGLTTVDIAASVETLEEGSFSECPWIRNISLKEGLSTIGASAFYNSLEEGTSIIIPATVTSIGDSAFSVWGTPTHLNVWFKGACPTLGENALLRMTVVYYPESWEEAPDDTNTEEGFITYRKIPSEVFDQVGKPATLPVPSLAQAENTPSGVRLSWDAVEGADGYIVYRCEEIGPENGYQTPIPIYLASTTAAAYVDTDVKSGDFLQYLVTAYNEEAVSYWGEEEQYQQITYLSQALLTSLQNASDGITLSWNAVEGAQGYYVWRKDANSGWTCIGSAEEGTLLYTDTLVSDGTTYFYGIQAYDVNSGSDYETSCRSITRTNTSAGASSQTQTSAASSGQSKLSVKAPKLTSVKNVKSRKLKIKWTKNSQADGYQIQYSTKSNFSKNTKTVTIKKKNTVTKTISKLKKKKKYYVRVRAYRTVRGVKSYSSWSKKKSVKIKK